MVYYPDSTDYTSSPSSDMSNHDYSQEYPRMPQQQPRSSRSSESYPSSYGGYPMSAITSSSSQYSPQYSPTTTQSSLYTWNERSDDYDCEDQYQRGSDARGSVLGGAPLQPTTTQSSLYTWNERSYDYDCEDQYQRGSDARGSVSESAPLQREYFCLFYPCRYSCARIADLERHVRNKHNRESARRFNCDVPGCHRKGLYSFTRKDKMRDHKREVHKIDIPKRARGKRDLVTGYEGR